MIGSVIDKYEVLQKLGEGATATVYRGRHISIGRDVAIKVLHPHLSASSRYRERFNREARAVGRLAHENIVSILDYSGQQADDCYIVTELVDGATLLKLLEDMGPIPSEVVAMIGIELCGALGFAHAHGVIHRDLKPENVMLRRDGRVKLMDFGVARVIDEGQITLDGSLLGSPAYMSPQQALDERLDGRSDLFSLGTVLFHTVSGQVPFAGSNASIILRNIIDGQRLEVLELNPAVSPALAAVIDRLLQQRPEDRYADAAEASAALCGVLVESGVPPEHPTLNLRSWLVQPNETTIALTTHLRSHLLARGKERLLNRDTVGALQLFNRLLAIDEDNIEVLNMITALHAPARPTRRASTWTSAAAALLFIVATAAWVLYPRNTAEREPPLAVPNTLLAVQPTQLDTQATAPILPAPERPDEVVPSLAIPVDARRDIKRTGVLSTPVASAPTATSPPVGSVTEVAAAPGRLTLEVLRPVDVWLDGKFVGKFRTGRRRDWVGTAERPIPALAGPHRLELKNQGAEDYVEEFTMGAGETHHVRAELRSKATVFVINSLVPRNCDVTVGTTHYGVIDGFKGSFTPSNNERETQVVFRCPEKGRFEMKLPATRAGEETIFPVELPEGML